MRRFDSDRPDARIASMLTRMREQGFEPPNPTTVDLAKLALPEEESLMRDLLDVSAPTSM